MSEKLAWVYVLDLVTRNILLFDNMTSEEAVVIAFERERGNRDPQTYPAPERHSRLVHGTLSVSCGQFVAMLPELWDKMCHDNS